MTLKNGEEEGVVFLLEGNDCKRSGLIFFFFFFWQELNKERRDLLVRPYLSDLLSRREVLPCGIG